MCGLSFTSINDICDVIKDLYHKVAFHLCLSTLLAKQKFQSREYFYLQNLCSDHEAQLYKYNFIYIFFLQTGYISIVFKNKNLRS